MRIDPLSSSGQISLEQQAEIYLKELEIHQKSYFQQFCSILNQPDQDHTAAEIHLKSLGQDLDFKAARTREAIQSLYPLNPGFALLLKERYEKRLDELYQDMSDLSLMAIAQAKEAIHLKHKEIASQMPINLADAVALQFLIKQCQGLIILTREQLQLVHNQRQLSLSP